LKNIYTKEYVSVIPTKFVKEVFKVYKRDLKLLVTLVDFCFYLKLQDDVGCEIPWMLLVLVSKQN